MRALGKSSVASVLKIALDVIWVFGWICAIAVFGLGMTSTIFSPGLIAAAVPVSFDLHPAAYTITADGVTTAEIENAEGTLQFKTSSRLFQAIFWLTIAIALAVLLYVLREVRRIFATLAAGSPFVAENAARLRRIGWVVIGGEVVGGGLTTLGQIVVNRVFMTTGISMNIDAGLELNVIFGGFVLIVLAEVFRMGVEIQNEQSLTV